MDGGKIMQSLQFKISLWLSIVILIFSVIAGAISAGYAYFEAIEFQDEQLKQIAALVERHQFIPQTSHLETTNKINRSEERFILQIWPKSGASPLSIAEFSQKNLPSSLATPQIIEAFQTSQNLKSGLQTANLFHQDWRIYLHRLNSGETIVVAQLTEQRDEIAFNSSTLTLIPLLILLPLLLLIIGILIRHIFKPLRQLSKDIEQRDEENLVAISDTNLPSEIKPFIAAINQLLHRVQTSLNTQKSFITNAAHELRSPITALSLQAEHLANADMSPQAGERLSTLRLGLRRTQALLEQLLTFARVQANTASTNVPISVHAAFKHVLEDLLPLAEQKNIDLGVVGDADFSLPIQAFDLNILLKNLVENALRYTLENGRVDLSVFLENQQIVIQVEDTGVGIAQDERERVFDPFYRILGNPVAGSGLGLSIVKTIVDSIGAQIRLEDANRLDSNQMKLNTQTQTHIGLRVKLIFPANLGLTQNCAG